jgi:hypothetical protein
MVGSQESWDPKAEASKASDSCPDADPAFSKSPPRPSSSDAHATELTQGLNNLNLGAKSKKVIFSDHFTALFQAHNFTITDLGLSNT